MATVGTYDAAQFVDLSDITLRYGGEATGTVALKGTSLTVAEGDFVAVVGPSGCGKSTLMKVVSGLWPVNGGAVTVAGERVKGPLSIVGMAFQSATLLPWRNTLANVMLPLEITKPHRGRLRANYDEYATKARDLLKLVGLEGFEEKYPWQLSGGMQQRVSLCRALIHDPDLLILDEPFGALDMFTREELWDVMQELWTEKRPTVILVTHDLREAAYLSNRVYVMSARPGRIIHSREVTAPRPRTLSATFTPEFAELTQDLRDNIQNARIAA
ncbi:MAG: ABC transporter ATP-binding protein [Pseudomonadota bacterium]